jgi:hypothetical protein
VAAASVAAASVAAANTWLAVSVLTAKGAAESSVLAEEEGMAAAMVIAVMTIHRWMTWEQAIDYVAATLVVVMVVAVAVATIELVEQVQTCTQGTSCCSN